MTPREKLSMLRQSTHLSVRCLHGRRQTDKQVIESLLTRAAFLQLFLEEKVQLEEFQEWANDQIITDNIELEKRG